MKTIKHIAVILSVLMSSFSVQAGQKYETSVVARTYAGFSERMSLYTDNARQRQYVAFYDSDRVINIAQRDLPDGPWKYRKLDECNPWDSHNTLALTMDSRGALHLTGNMHVQKLMYYCTDESGDISTLKKLDKLVGTLEDLMTYPGFIHLGNGDLLFHYRHGRSGNGFEVYDRCDTKGNWSRFLDKPLIDGKGKRNAYMTNPRLYKDGYFHMVWVWRDSPDCATNHDLSYARSKDLVHWESATGTPLEIPITIDDKELIVDPIPCSGGALNGGQTLGWDVSGNPVIVYFKYDENGHTNLYAARFSGKEWSIRKITDWDFRWELAGGGSIVRELWIDKLANDAKGNVTVAYRKREPSTGKIYSRILTLDRQNLKPVGEKPLRERAYPEWMDKSQTGIPGIQVNVIPDFAGGKEWFLRWECLPNNRDLPVLRDVPEPTELQVIHIPAKGKSEDRKMLKYFRDLPAGTDPVAIGTRVAYQFLSCEPESYAPKGYDGTFAYGDGKYLMYAPLSLWVNALEFSRNTGNTSLEQRLVDHFEPFYKEKKHIQNKSNHVDFALFGALPLEIYILRSDERARKLGLFYADKQWGEPDPHDLGATGNFDYKTQKRYLAEGYSPQTRLWIDDMYMINALQTQAFRATGDIRYIERAAKEMVYYLEKLQLENGLFNHAPDVPQIWGRGNGWMAAGMPMILKYLPKDNPYRPVIMEGYRKMMRSLLEYQHENGLWGQLVTDPESWDETSCSAMFAYGFIEGIKNGWLDGKTYGPAARKAWISLCSRLDEHANISDVCIGTNRLNNREYYLKRPRFNGDPHGQAPMMWIANALTSNR